MGHPTPPTPWLTEPDALHWSDALLLGLDEIDDEHREFVDLINALQRCADTDVLACLDRFIAHAQAHFAHEDDWMTSTAFPPARCHIAEHAAVLKSAFEARAMAGTGELAFARQFADDLAAWFPAHVEQLDSALATWMFKLKRGGRPVVLRRDIIRRAPAPA